MIDAPMLIARLAALVPGASLEPGSDTDQPTIYVTAGDLVPVVGVLHDTADLGFSYLADLTAVDWWPKEPRFEMVYHLASFEPSARLRLKVRVPGSAAHVPTLKGVWPSADWLEREVWDLFGIVFDGHNDLRRLLMPDEWEGHPLRKDYPVQVNLPVRVGNPLQVSEEEFRENIELDRRIRGAAGTGADAGPRPVSQEP
jgi:NADH-quinone oxidoreductase subunit C